MTAVIILAFIIGLACGLRAGQGWTLRRLGQAERHRRIHLIRENSHRPPGT